MDSTKSTSSAVMPQPIDSPDRPGAVVAAPILHRLLVPLGNLLFWTRNAVFPIVFIALALLFRPVWPSPDAASDLWLDLAGVAVSLCGQALRVTVIGLAYIKRGGKNKRVWADKLVTTGLFGHCRNPLYVGNFLMLLGLIVVHNSPWMYATCLPFFAVSYLAITLAEEQYLLGKFGEEYTAYCARVPRFLIRLRGLGHTVRGMRFDWRKAINKEHGTTMTWFLTLIGLLAWEQIANVGLEASRRRIESVLIAFAVACVVYLTIRVLKKKTDLIKPWT